jgi:arylsulfatase A-like enzyme
MVAVAALASFYAWLNIALFGIFGSFLTYPLVLTIGDVRMLSSSVSAYLTPPVVLGLVGVPVLYVGLVMSASRIAGRAPRWARAGSCLAAGTLACWFAAGQHLYESAWATRQERRIAENMHWVFVSSWWRATAGGGGARMAGGFAAGDLADFESIGIPSRPPQRAGASSPAPVNVIVIVLESVAARWTGLNSAFETTPRLVAESARGIVFENAYAHTGRSSNSLAAMLLSLYPKLGFREATEEYPDLPVPSVASVFREHGYHTAFLTPSDLRWATWERFLANQGFGDIRDHRNLGCATLVSSWGAEDRCMIDAVIDMVRRKPAAPLFVMGWTSQTHHPYEPTPGVPMQPLLRERGPDDYALERYLNVLHETDRHLGRLFDAVREAGLERDTLIVVVGDHGQAFGSPHMSWFQGQTVYEEDVHVPLLIWFPRRYRSGARSDVIASQIDLAPTIAELAGLPAAAEWQGRSLFAPARMPRAYFYVADDRFTLGIRDGAWKYMFDLREGRDELYDLERDPTEQQNLAPLMPERAARMRRRLAAWAEANRRRYGEPAGVSSSLN